MAAEQTDALVLRIYPWSETSLVVNLFTRDFGKIAVLAKGARRPKSQFEAALDLLSTCRVVFIPKSGDALDILTEAKLEKRFRGGQSDLLRLYIGYYLIELLDALTDRGERQSEVFDLAVATLESLADPICDPRAITLRLELQLLRLVGSLPSWRSCAQCGGEVEAQDGFLAFGAIAGGIVCDRCRSATRGLMRLRKATRDEFERYCQHDWRSANMTVYPSADRARLRAVMQRYITVLLDRKLQMYSYLQELGR